jgi:tetratricopeptide (TPR) repeat protein
MLPAEATAPAQQRGASAPGVTATTREGDGDSGEAIGFSSGLAAWREEQISLYQAEAHLDEVANPRRAARLLNEVARLCEQRPGGAREAARLYTESLSSDPTLQANTWALFRLFSARESWENVLRLIDAEARFAPLPTADDRADLLLEKGRILEDRLGRDEEALAAFRAALATAPGHPGALLALLLLGVSSRDVSAIDEALAGLATHVQNPRLRALFVVERARQQRGSIVDIRADLRTEGNGAASAERMRRAADTLFHGLSSVVADAESEDAICAELDRLSLLSGDADLRSRVLDALDARFGHEHASRNDPALLVAVHREKARLLSSRGARDGALAVLERGLRLTPGHPLLVADLLDLADQAGRPDAIAALERDGHLAAGLATEEAALRRADAAARNGAYGEAMGILAGLPPDGPMAAQATLLRTRVLARTGDLEGLADAFIAAADRLSEGGSSEQARDLEARHEAAHLLVRAAVLRGMGAAAVSGDLGDAAAKGEALLARALELARDFAPAREAQRLSAIRRGDAVALGALYEHEATIEADPDRRGRLLRSAFLIQRDLARDAVAAKRLAEHAPPVEPLIEAVRLLDDAGETSARLASQTGQGAETDAAAADVVEALGPVIRAAGDDPATAGLWLLGARLAATGGRAEQAQELAQRAFTLDPAGGAAPLLEEYHRRAGATAAAADVLGAELRALEATAATSGGAGEILRGLRFRLASTAGAAGRVEEALAALGPLRDTRDRAALMWSLELARRTGDPALELALFREPAIAELLSADGADGALLLRLARAEAELALAEAGAGQTGFHAPVATVAEHELPPAGSAALAAEVALTRLRIRSRAAGDDQAAEVGAFAALAEALAGTAVGAEINQESELLSLAHGVTDAAPAAQFTPGGGSAWRALGSFVTGVRRSDRALQLGGLEQLALRAGPPTAATFGAQVGLRQTLAGQTQQAAATFARVLAAGPSPLAEVAVTDLIADLGDVVVDVRALPAWHAAGAARAERLAGSASAANLAVAAALYAESAGRDEAEGKLGAAAAGYARLIDLDPSSTEAVLGLERAARMGGDRRGQAAALLRLGSLLRDPRAAAERVAEAARLFEEDGLTEDAGAAFTQVLRLLPRDDDAYRRLHDILVERDDPAALERLISFKLAQLADETASAETPVGAETTAGVTSTKIALYAERAGLRLGVLDRREDGIDDHRRIVAVDPANVPSLRTLAGLASAADCPEIAARFLVEALPHTDGDVAHRVRLDLAAAYVAAEADESAIEILRDTAAARPTDQETRERLVDVGMRLRRWDLVADQFRALAAHADNPADQAAWTVRLGRLERDQRREVPQALDAFREALRLDPLGEAPRELCATLGEVPLAPEDAPAVGKAVATLRETIKRNPLSPRRLESLSALARTAGLTDLSEIAAQLLALLGGPPSRGRSRGIVRSLALDAFAPEAQDARVRRASDLWRDLAPAVARLHEFDPAKLGISRSTRLAPGSEPRLAWADAAANGLGLSTLVMHIAGPGDRAVEAFDGAPPVLVLGRGVPGGDAATRFKVGRALTLLAQQAALCDRVSLDDLERDWAAAILLLADRADGRFEPAALRAQAKALGKVMSRKERKALDERAAGLEPTSIDVASWRARIFATANRGGLLVSGDLGAALRSITSQAGTSQAAPSPADLESDECLDVIQFAFGDRFAALREEVRQRDRINTGEHGGR